MKQFKEKSKISFSPNRGMMHLIDDKYHNTTVIANGGAQLMNSSHYRNRHINLNSADIVDSNEEFMNAFMLGFTNPSDTYLYRFGNLNHFKQIRKSYEAINIQLTQEYVQILAKEYPSIGSIMPQVLSPEILQAKNMRNTSEKIVAAYRKDVSQQLWEQDNVPTPPTLYINRNDSRRAINSKLESLSNFKELVINITEGSGGFGLEFVSFSNAECKIAKMLKNFPEENKIMVQGKLELEASPGINFAITDSQVSFIQVADQRFASAGAFGGNHWYKEISKDYESRYPGFLETCSNAARSLQKYGVRGQVNMDILLISPETAHKYSLPQILIREANVRSSGSSPITRFSNSGNINGKEITQILTNTYHKISERKFLKLKKSKYPGIRHVIYNYNKSNTMFLAILGTSNISTKEMIAYEKNTLRNLHAWR